MTADAAENSQFPEQKTPSPYRVIVPMFLYFLTLSMQAGTFNLYAIDSSCETLYGIACNILNDQDRNHASGVAAILATTSVSASYFLSLFTTAALGSLSDRVGRRPVLLFAAACYFINCSGCALVAYMNWNLWYAMPFFIVSGLGGGLGTFNAAAFAYVADTSDAERRSTIFAALESAIFLGAAAGPLISSCIYQMLNPTWAFVSAAGCAVLNFFFILLFFPSFMAKRETQKSIEKRKQQRRHQREQEGGGCCDCLLDVPQFQLVVEKQLYLPVILFGLVYALYVADVSILTPFVKLPPFDLTATQVGYLSTEGSLTKWLALCVLFPSAVRLLGCREEQARVSAVNVVVGLSAVAYCAYGFVHDTWQLYLVVGLNCPLIIALPCIRSIMSLSVGPTEQGTVLSMVANIETLGNLVVPVAMGHVWATTVGWNRSFCYWAISGCMSMVFLLSFRMHGVGAGGKGRYGVSFFDEGKRKLFSKPGKRGDEEENADASATSDYDSVMRMDVDPDEEELGGDSSLSFRASVENLIQVPTPKGESLSFHPTDAH